MSSTQEKTLRTIKDLPNPKRKAIVGHLPDFKKENRHEIIENWVKEVGDLFQISLMGKKFIVSADHDFNHEILKSRPNGFRRFSKIAEIMEEMGIYGVFAAEGNEWKQQRKITSEALSLKNVKGFLPIISQMTERLMQRWEKAAQNNMVVDIQKDMTLFTVDVTTSIAFGYDTNTLEKGRDDLQDHLEKIFPMINDRITAPLPLWRYIKGKKDKELDDSLVLLQKTVNDFIHISKEKLAKNPDLKENPSNFLEALLVEQEKDSNFSDNDVFGNVFTILLAGEDTTSNSISWALYYLASHPEVFEKVRKEADEVLGDALFPTTNEEITQLKYTEFVAHETIRLKSVAPTLLFQPLEDTVVQGLSIEKGQTILLQTKVAQTEEKNFERAEEFLPERWNRSTGCPFHGTHNPDTIKSFGGGSRYCPGRNLAIYEIKMAVAMIAKNFDLSFAGKSTDVKEFFAFTMYPKNLLVKLKKRS